MISSEAAAAPQAQQPPAFRPSCVVCVSDCDGDASFTSCHHFVCSRCSAKYPQGTCPRCQKPCRTVKVSSTPGVAERVNSNASRAVAAAMQAMEFQRRQDAITIQRLKELVGLFNGQHRAAAAKAASLQEQNTNLQRELRDVKGALDQARLAVAHQQQRYPTNAGASGGYHHHAPHHDSGVPPTPLPGTDTAFALPQWSAEHHAGRPPTAGLRHVNSTPSVFGKRDRDASPLGSCERAAHQAPMQPSPGDRFVLATPAVSLSAAAKTAQGGGTAGAQPLPRLQSLLPSAPSGGARLVHSSCGHGAPFPK